jgi:hypothetical protein
VVSSANETDRHDITEILLKVALNTTIITPLWFDVNMYEVFLKIKCSNSVDYFHAIMDVIQSPSFPSSRLLTCNTTGATNGAGTAYHYGTPGSLVGFVFLDL